MLDPGYGVTFLLGDPVSGDRSYPGILFLFLWLLHLQSLSLLTLLSFDLSTQERKVERNEVGSLGQRCIRHWTFKMLVLPHLCLVGASNSSESLQPPAL